MAKWTDVPLPMFNQATCDGSPNAISLLASADGPTPCDLPDGQTINTSGLGVVPVSRSRKRGNRQAKTTRAISGPNGFGSSASVALQLSLENRLKQRFATAGSILYVTTWSEKATPSGRRVCRVQASARRISAIGCGSWRTPTTEDHKSDGPKTMAHYEANLTNGVRLPNSARRLRNQAQALASWATPKVATGKYCYSNGNHDKPTLNLEGQAELANWPTPTSLSPATEKHHEAGDSCNLRTMRQLATRATPTTRDYKDGSSDGLVPTNGLLGRQAWEASGPMPTGSTVETGNIGQLNPAHSRWLMGYPPAWDACGVTAMPSSRKLRQNSSKRT